MPDHDLLTMFFPMWNEEETIHRTVAAAHEAGRRLVGDGEVGDYEILLVDDASVDGTGKLADEIAERDRHVRVVHHQRNGGLGAAMRTGFRDSRGDVVLYTDADLPFDMLEMSKAMRLMRIYEADLVSAYRLDRTGEGPRRAIYSYIYNHLIRVALGLRLRDVNFAFKVVRRDVLDHLELTSAGSFIDVELLAKAERLGFRTVQFGVDYFPRTRGVSTLSSAPVIAKMVREALQIVPETRRLQPLPEAQRRP